MIENGNQTRGEFILEQLEDNKNGRPGLVYHNTADDVVCKLYFENGFVKTLECDHMYFRTFGRTLFRNHPIENAVLNNVYVSVNIGTRVYWRITVESRLNIKINNQSITTLHNKRMMYNYFDIVRGFHNRLFENSKTAEEHLSELLVDLHRLDLELNPLYIVLPKNGTQPYNKLSVV